MPFDINISKLIPILIGMSLFIISGSIHEFAHALSAYVLGDDTARYNGRLTINPIAHIDIFGTILFPLFSIITGVRLLGWMRPVPVNPGNFKNPPKGHAITSFAGPFSNFMQASIGIIIFKIFSLVNFLIFFKNNLIIQIIFFIIFIIEYYIKINITLMIFNLLPVPPLDGGWILRYFLPPQFRDRFDNIYRFGIIILYVILLSGLLRIIFRPFDVFLDYIFININNINIGFIISPFFAGLLLIYIFLKDEINTIIKRKKFTTSNKKGEKEFEKNLIDAKRENLIISKKLQDILKKIKSNIKLNEKDKEFINKIKNNFKEPSNLCKEIDFSIDDTHCNECEYFINCLLRKMKIEKASNKIIDTFS